MEQKRRINVESVTSKVDESVGGRGTSTQTVLSSSETISSSSQESSDEKVESRDGSGEMEKEKVKEKEERNMDRRTE